MLNLSSGGINDGAATDLGAETVDIKRRYAVYHLVTGADKQPDREIYQGVTAMSGHNTLGSDTCITGNKITQYLLAVIRINVKV